MAAESVSAAYLFHQLMSEYGHWLRSGENVYVAGTITSPFSGASAGAVKRTTYPCGHLLHHVLVRRVPQYDHERRFPARLTLATYSSRIDEATGRICLDRLLHHYNLFRGFNDTEDARADPQAIPRNKAWLLGVANSLIEAVLGAHQKQYAVHQKLRMSEFYVPALDDPRRILTRTPEAKRLALYASGPFYEGPPLPSTVCPYDAYVRKVVPGHVDRRESHDDPNYVPSTQVLIYQVPKDDAGNPLQPLGENDQDPDESCLITLPEQAVLNPAVKEGARLSADVVIAQSLPRRRYSSLKELATMLKDKSGRPSDEALDEYIRECVQGQDGREFPGMRLAEFQDPISNCNVPVYEVPVAETPMAMVSIASYNRRDALCYENESVLTDLWRV